MAHALYQSLLEALYKYESMHHFSEQFHEASTTFTVISHLEVKNLGPREVKELSQVTQRGLVKLGFAPRQFVLLTTAFCCLSHFIRFLLMVFKVLF